MTVQIELLLLVLSALFFLSVFAGKASSKYGVPALLLFLAVGMICGTDGVGIEFDNIYIAQTIGTVALCIILFSGGMDTKFSEIKPIMLQGFLLSTIGVLLTALCAGVLIWLVLGCTMPGAGIGFLSSLLLAATMSSTDSASVFSILRSKGVHLKQNLRPMLELESGSNDPMAYMLVITILDVMKMGTEVSGWMIVFKLLMQLVVGGLAGYLFGKLAVFVINKIKIGNDALYPILVLTFCIFIFSATYYLQGNGYLAVYIGGLVIGNSKFVHKRSSMKFFEGLAWLFQLVMFLTLGLLVNPHELLPIALPALIISLLMILIARPLSVILCLLPFRKMSVRAKSYISWVGLRGAVPIIFAIMPLAENIPHARLMFNIVFFCTLVSLLIQGTSLPLVARWMKLSEKSKNVSKLRDFDIDVSNDIKTVLAEVELNENTFEVGNRLMDIKLPDNSLAVMVKREEKYFVPTGKTELNPKDKLLIMTDDYDSLQEVYKKLKVEK
ncbi:MAG: potassium/proton antiporter [Bacteroidales bacterium]|nr:potassium/proton antiporter [Bacteroidales bacterium]MEE1093376.1 potassium/proton antiporter [Bacteroidales bacterium]